MKTGWYKNDGQGWYWDGSRRRFTDHINESNAQFSCCVRDMSTHDVDRMEEMLDEATRQVRAGGQFLSLDGPHDVEDILS